MRIFKNKKGSPIFSILIVLGAFFVLTQAYSVITNKELMSREADVKAIGRKQMRMFDAYQEGENLLLYIDHAALFTTYQVLHVLGKYGGYVPNAPCGAWRGYSLWRDENLNDDCWPTMSAISSSFSYVFNTNITPFMHKRDFPIDEIQFYTGFSQGDDFTVTGAGDRLIHMIYPYFESEKVKVELGEPIPIGTGDPDSGGGYTLDFIITNMPSEGKCGYVADYAKQYLHCKYSLTVLSAQKNPPAQCNPTGLTCAGFVHSVYYNLFGIELWGDGYQKCDNNPELLTKFGTNVNLLQPGDIFQANSAVAAGHTGIYVGRGFVDPSISTSYWGRTCYERYTPDPNGEHLFIQSIGNSNGGEPGVCIESYNSLFVNRMTVTSFCRYKGCQE